MSVYHWILTCGVGIFLFSALTMLSLLLTRKVTPDPSPARGKKIPAIIYSFTGSMSPFKKETAYLHLPTYTAGMVFHIGTFLSFAWLVVFFFGIRLSVWFSYMSMCILFISALCGLGIFIKRIGVEKLRALSNPDDYFSNFLVTGFQVITMLTILNYRDLPVLFIYAAFFWVYIPVGKLRHTLFFFTSRIQLGRFYGKRGVWPVNKVTGNGK